MNFCHQYWVSHRSLTGRGLRYPYLGGMGDTNVFDHPPPPTHTHTHSLLRIKIKTKISIAVAAAYHFWGLVSIVPRNQFFSHSQHTQPEYLDQTQFMGTTLKLSL